MSTWTPNFSEHEFLRSATASELGLSLGWTIPEHRANALRLTRRVLEPLRARVGRPIHITSGYRSEALTEALRAKGYSASRTSDHMTGRAVDIVVRGLTHEELAVHAYQLWAEGRIEVDQGIWYQPGTGGSFHISHRNGANRSQWRVATPEGLRPWMPTPPPRDDTPVGEMTGVGGLFGVSVLP